MRTITMGIAVMAIATSMETPAAIAQIAHQQPHYTCDCTYEFEGAVPPDGSTINSCVVRTCSGTTWDVAASTTLTETDCQNLANQCTAGVSPNP
jgi:hypothetical protein